MKVNELMANHTPKADYTGWVTNDDYVFAIDLTSSATQVTDVGNYAVVEMGIAGLDAQMNPVTQDKQYIRAGQSTTKTGTQRSFSVTGDRYVGDEAQDYCLSHAVKYGTGNGVITNYVYYNILTGKGEKGQCSIIVNSDGSGNAGESSAVDIEFKKIGSNPVEYTFIETMKTLVVTSVAGTSGKTKITVTPQKQSGNSYVYKTGASVSAPALNESCATGYTEWDGVAEITATASQKILIVEVDAQKRAKGSGISTVTVG